MTVVTLATQRTIKDLSVRITAAWKVATDAYIECGNLLIEAKAALGHGHFQNMIRDSLPFGRRHAGMLMKVAIKLQQVDPRHLAKMPPHIGTLNQLARMTPQQLNKLCSTGRVHPRLQRTEASKLRSPHKTISRAARVAVVINRLDGISDLWALAEFSEVTSAISRMRQRKMAA